MIKHFLTKNPSFNYIINRQITNYNIGPHNTLYTNQIWSVSKTISIYDGLCIIADKKIKTKKKHYLMASIVFTKYTMLLHYSYPLQRMW